MKILFCFLCFLAIKSTAQQNLDDIIKERLVAKITKHLPRERMSCSIKELKYYAEASDIKALTEKSKRLPDSVVQEVYKNTNCSSKERGWNENFSISFTSGESYSFSQNIVSSSSLTININLPFELGSSSANYSKSVSLNDTKTWNKQTTETRQRTIDVTVEPNSTLYVRLRSTVSLVQIPFSGNFTVNGVATVQLRDERFGGIDLEPKEVSISSILSPEERKIQIDGYVINAKETNIDVRYSSKKNKPTECMDVVATAGQQTSTRREEISDELLIGKKPTKRQIEFLKQNQPSVLQENDSKLVKGVEVDSLSFAQVIEDYLDNTTIKTSNSVANVEVRHTSFGPGFCNVITRNQYGNQVGVNAPPIIWSGWQVLTSHIGEATYNISNQVNCDTGVRSQVRYFKR